jgi:dTDP-glucose 4,6-dehydratase
MRVLVTGGCGFLGSNFVKRLVAGGDDAVVLDRLADFETLARLEGVPHEFVQGDVADAVTATGAADGCAAIVNFAAETNLDESGLASGGFIVTDVFGTHVLLEFARIARIPFVQVSTADASAASSPPAASRAAADLQVRAYVETYGLRGSIVRGVSAYGPFQRAAAEPAASIVQALGEAGAALEPPPGSWLHADDHSAAVERILRDGAAGEIYSVGEDDEAVHALGWTPEWSLGEGFAETIEWYRAHPEWWEPLNESRSSFADQYARRGGA